MKALGLNPGEQEMIDMTNEVSVNGLIYYPDFCKLVLRKYREENRETLNQALFKVMVEIICVTFLCQNLLIFTHLSCVVLVGLVLKLRAAWSLPPLPLDISILCLVL